MEAILAFGPGRQKWAVQKGALFKKEKESARRTARCHVSLEKSSKNYIRCESEPSQADIHSLTPPPPTSWRIGGLRWRIFHVVGEMCELEAPWQLAMTTHHLEGRGRGESFFFTVGVFIRC